MAKRLTRVRYLVWERSGFQYLGRPILHNVSNWFAVSTSTQIAVLPCRNVAEVVIQRLKGVSTGAPLPPTPIEMLFQILRLI